MRSIHRGWPVGLLRALVFWVEYAKNRYRSSLWGDSDDGGCFLPCRDGRPGEPHTACTLGGVIAAPGIDEGVASALVLAAESIGKENVRVILDVNEENCRVQKDRIVAALKQLGGSAGNNRLRDPLRWVEANAAGLRRLGARAKN